MWRSASTIVKETISDFGSDDVMTKAAALALYWGGDDEGLRPALWLGD